LLEDNDSGRLIFVSIKERYIVRIDTKNLNGKFPNLTNGMLAAAARDAKSKAIVLKSLAFASLPEESREEADLRAASTEYRTLWGWVCGGVCALRTRVTPSMTQIITGIDLVFEKKPVFTSYNGLQQFTVVTLSHCHSADTPGHSGKARARACVPRFHHSFRGFST
jgi:hypothetical protein